MADSSSTPVPMSAASGPTWCPTHRTMRGEPWPRYTGNPRPVEAADANTDGATIGLKVMAVEWIDHRCHTGEEPVMGAAYLSVTVGTDEHQYDAELTAEQAAEFIGCALEALHRVSPMSAHWVAAGHVGRHTNRAAMAVA